MRRTVGRILLFGALLLTVSFVVLMANQTVQLADLAARVHPMAGQGVFWARRSPRTRRSSGNTCRASRSG
jgi:hypothetical protein